MSVVSAESWGDIMKSLLLFQPNVDLTAYSWQLFDPGNDRRCRQRANVFYERIGHRMSQNISRLNKAVKIS